MEPVYLIIINYKSEDVIKDCINSIIEDYIDLHIIVVDNGSTDSSFKKLKQITNRKVEIISSKNNLGFSGGVNFAYRYIKKKYYRVNFIFLLNPDTISSKNLIGKLLNTLNNNTGAAAISPLVTDMNNSIWYQGGYVDWINCFITYKPKKNIITSEVSKIDVFCGAAVLINAKLFEECGMLYENGFLYYEEVILSKKIMDNGYDILFDPKLMVKHHVSYTINEKIKSYYLIRNHIIFFKKHKHRLSNTRSPYKYPIAKLVGSLNPFNIKLIYFILLGIWQGIRQKEGQL